MSPSARRPSGEHRRQVAIVGTFDVANFGDLLFPELALHELRARLGEIELRRYSYRPLTSPPWVYPVHSLEDLIRDLDDVELLLVGGGHLVRFDKAVAPGYEPTASHHHHPTSYWLAPTLLAAGRGVPVVWNALGASSGTPEWGQALLAAAVASADYVAVRDTPSRIELNRVAPGEDVAQVPDSAFGVRRYLAGRGPSQEVARLREQFGIDRPYVIVQPSSRLLPAVDAIREAVTAVRESGRLILELPISPALDDRPGMLSLEGLTSIDPWPSPTAIAEIIAGADAVVTHSLLQTIVAIASGVPAFRLPAAEGSKYESMTRYRDVLEFEPQGTGLAEGLLARSRREPAPDVLEQEGQVGGHWDRVAAVVTEDNDKARDRRRQSAARLQSVVPSVLEDLTRAGAERLESAEERIRALEAERDQLTQRIGELDAKLLGQEQQLAELNERHDGLQAEAAQAQQRVAADRRLLEEELALRNAQLIEASATARRLTATRKDLRRTKAAYIKLRRRRSVRLALRLAAAVRGTLRGGRRSMARATRTAGQSRRSDAIGTRAPYRATIQEEAELTKRLIEELPQSARSSGPLVSIVTLNHNGAKHLARLLPALERTTYRSFELIVVDNASTDVSRAVIEGSARTHELKVLWNDTNRSFSEACNQALAAAAGELILLLNNDIEPVTPGWLGRLVTTLDERKATAVGARLIYPRRPGLKNGGDTQRPDLTLQHRGIGFVPADGVPTAVNLGGGMDPTSPAAARTGEATALTAACLLVRRDALAAVGGLTEGYTYGTEDVDLSLKLRAAGGSLIYDGGAALWHHEYGTQNMLGRDWKRENRRRNRQLFVDRWGPQIFRDVFVDRVKGLGRWSEEPLHVAITLTRDDPRAGRGDYYTAKELGAACESLGWRISYLERHGDRWYDIDPSIDVLISLLDALDLRLLPRHLVTVAWIRNWTHRWISHPWFEEYDLVFTSSSISQQLVEERTAKVASLMPIATNAERFGRASPSEELASDVLFVGNYWGQPRGVIERLHVLEASRTIGLYGTGWERTILARHHRGKLDYERLPDAYASAGVVIDDTAGPTKPYGAVNSRVFDALASGALVISDNPDGIRELFDDEFPIAADPTELQSLVDRFLADRTAAQQLAERYRQIVLERHTYHQRARQLQDALASWAESERYGILIGAPDWDRALSWGDYHYARSLQRQLERRGKPTRVHLLPDWERAPAARDDVVVHLFGLSEYRTRLGQVNLMWNISHPDLVTTSACERYDLILVASDPFAAKLAPSVSTPVRPLHQATDPDRFHPDPTAPAHDILFVGSSRNVRRKVIEDLLPTPFDLAIYGKQWSPDIVDPMYVKGDYIPNDVLHRYYSAAKIVLADHWDDMRREGFLSNRLYDALASGAFVISDEVVGIDQEFDGCVITYSDRADLHDAVAYYLQEEETRQSLGDRGRHLVLARHTFAHRAEAIIEEADAILARRPATIREWETFDLWHRRRQLRRAEWKRRPTPPATDAVAAVGRPRSP